MKRLAMLSLLGAMVIGSIGCSCGQRLLGRGGSSGCDSGACDDGSGGRGRHGRRDGGNGGDGSGGGMAPTVAYPYYTTRGPRDFFACDPGYPRN
jgi:hypothetical protein